MQGAPPGWPRPHGPHSCPAYPGQAVPRFPVGQVGLSLPVVWSRTGPPGCPGAPFPLGAGRGLGDVLGAPPLVVTHTRPTDPCLPGASPPSSVCFQTRMEGPRAPSWRPGGGGDIVTEKHLAESWLCASPVPLACRAPLCAFPARGHGLCVRSSEDPAGQVRSPGDLESPVSLSDP